MTVQIPFAGEKVSEPTGIMVSTWYRAMQALFSAFNTLDGLPRGRVSGSVTVTGAATTGTASFTAQATATYALSLTPASVTGAPAASSSVVRSIAKTTTGFTVTVQVAPGVGTSVTFDYLVIS